MLITTQNSRYYGKCQYFSNLMQVTCSGSHLRVQDTRKRENDSCLNLMIHATWQQQVSWLWKPSDGVELFVVSSPGVNEALWNEALLWRFVRTKVNSDVCWNVHERTTLVVDGLFDWMTNIKQVTSAMHTNTNSKIFLHFDCLSIAVLLSEVNKQQSFVGMFDNTDKGYRIQNRCGKILPIWTHEVSGSQ